MNPFFYHSAYIPYRQGYRDVSPPRNAYESPRPGYYPADYRSVSPLGDDDYMRGRSVRPGLGRRMTSTGQMHANLHGIGDLMMREDGIVRGRGRSDW
ncbi:hypothetical protein T440DRAFT_515255 [Plenodomus tracheiphilus IPT5]|uniref:Uncharacterized protein n=1 Tax=Plenodomus tracheiphilus IPT5 TaxID=1408161 RepID=A0A6A7BE43_9PLEO|nr:hypothetical protein T440DRAFT_515255 [Plenodomus tracheiphilus IPT5]